MSSETMEPNYASIVESALEQYGKEEISPAATRGFELGKFLFAVASFSMLSCIALTSALGPVYSVTFLSFYNFYKCIVISLSLSYGRGYSPNADANDDDSNSINASTTLLEDYNETVSNIDTQIGEWRENFKTGIIIVVVLVPTLFVGNYIEKKFGAKKTKTTNVHLIESNTQLKNIHRAIIGLQKCSNVTHLDNSTIMEKINLLNSNIEQVGNNLLSFSQEHSQHVDRHLKITTNKIGELERNILANYAKTADLK